MLLVGLGILLGLFGGLTGARSLESFLNGVSTTDMTTFTATIALLSAVALVACAIPARRAVRINPIAALRHE
jgi:putative ABC transport system permease protein